MDGRALSHLYQRVNQPELGTLDFSARVRAGVDLNPGEALDAVQNWRQNDINRHRRRHRNSAAKQFQHGIE